MKKLLFFYFLSFTLLSTVKAQLSIPFPNASFEENHAPSSTPRGWFNCIFDGQSNIDIHGKNTLYYDVEEEAYEGENFIGMVTRATGTFETLGCRLPRKITAGQTYFLKFHTNRSTTYHCNTSTTKREFAYFNSPVQVYIYGGGDDCTMEEILAITPSNEANGWQKQGLVLKPSKDFSHIFFSAYYPDPENPGNGNVLIDKIEPLDIYTDTIRYQALCLNGEYICTLDKQTLTPPQLKDAILQYNKKILASNSSDVRLSTIEYNVSLIHQMKDKLSKKGVLEYLFNEKSKVQKAELQALHQIGALLEWETLSRGLEIHLRGKRETINEVDQLFFEQISETFLEINQIDQRLNDYIWRNKFSILNSFGRCIH